MSCGASKVKFLDGTVIEVYFESGEIKQFDVSTLFEEDEELLPLSDPELFKTGKLITPYNVSWGVFIDLDLEVVYYRGTLVGNFLPKDDELRKKIGKSFLRVRKERSLTQDALSQKSGIDQSDISKIERGLTNLSIDTLERLATALDCSLYVYLKKNQE